MSQSQPTLSHGVLEGLRLALPAGWRVTALKGPQLFSVTTPRGTISWWVVAAGLGEAPTPCSVRGRTDPPHPLAIRAWEISQGLRPGEMALLKITTGSEDITITRFHQDLPGGVRVQRAIIREARRMYTAIKKKYVPWSEVKKARAKEEERRLEKAAERARLEAEAKKREAELARQNRQSWTVVRGRRVKKKKRPS